MLVTMQEEGPGLKPPAPSERQQWEFFSTI